jgi:class 3 adenylate cyclase
MAVEMVEALENINRENNLTLKIRIGVCCGPCVGSEIFI